MNIEQAGGKRIIRKTGSTGTSPQVLTLVSVIFQNGFKLYCKSRQFDVVGGKIINGKKTDQLAYKLRYLQLCRQFSTMTLVVVAKVDNKPLYLAVSSVVIC